MAILNKTEKLIVQAAKQKNTFESKVFEDLVDYYEKFEFENNVDLLTAINYLYCENNHKGKTFDNIAREVLHMGVSSLEKARKKFQNMYLFIYDRLKTKSKPAA